MVGGNLDGSPPDRLLEVAMSRGQRFMGGGNHPIQLWGHDAFWLIVRGSVDVFAARMGEDGVPAEFNHLLRAGPGRLVFPLSHESGLKALVVKGLPDSELWKVPFDALNETGLDTRIVEQVNAWVSEVSESVVQAVTYRLRMDLSLNLGDSEEVVGGATITAHHGVLWMSSQDGELEFLGTEELEPSGSGMVPVTALSWVVQNRTASVKAASTRELYLKGQILDALMEFNRLAMRAHDTNRALALADVFNFRTASALHRQLSEERARRSLFSVLSGQPPRMEGDSALWRVLEQVGSHESIQFRGPPRTGQSASYDNETTLDEIINSSGVRARSVALRHHQRWWLSDSGAMLAFRREDGSPVALLPGATGRYVMFDPQTQGSMALNARRAAALSPRAHFFYRPLPDRGHGRIALLLGMVFNRALGDLLRLFVAGVFSGLAMLAPAVLLGIFVRQVLPSGDLQMLAMVALATLLIGLAFTLLNMLKGTALMRVEGRAAARISAAIWDRLLVLPSAFFRRFTVGDLGSRAMGFQYLRDQVAGVVVGAFLSLIFLLTAFVILLLYDTVLGALGLSMGLFSLALTVFLGLRQMPYHRAYLATSRRLTGVLLQLISGVAKLRVSGAEPSAFAMGATSYREQKHTEMKLGALNEHAHSIHGGRSILCHGRAAPGGTVPQRPRPCGGQLPNRLCRLHGLLRRGSPVRALILRHRLHPANHRASRTHLRRKPQEDNRRSPHDRPEGRIAHRPVTFRYTEDGPLVLQDVSLHARPGEFIALVGESGSGKRTLLRLALGLESPQSGVMYYDGHDLGRLNRQAVRNGVGMVVQDASLRPQTILDNIIGTGNDLTVENAWEAARLAAVDVDIAEMPMGMYTITSEGSSAFSGGQTQRIMLTAALVRNPSVLLLDEATNWLDNETQTRVMEEIEKLSVTRIVSAHRLSTIQRANRIYVLEEGRVIQRGTFEELREQEGVFREMVLRQIA